MTNRIGSKVLSTSATDSIILRTHFPVLRVHLINTATWRGANSDGNFTEGLYSGGNAATRQHGEGLYNAEFRSRSGRGYVDSARGFTEMEDLRSPNVGANIVIADWSNWPRGASDLERRHGTCTCGGLGTGGSEQSTQQPALGTVTIFTDAQAAIRRVTSDDPNARGHGQKAHRCTPRQGARSASRDPVVSGPPGHRRKRKWAKLAADEPNAHGVPRGRVSQRRFPLSRSLGNLKRGSSEKKWAGAQGWAKKLETQQDEKPEVPPQ